ncbi:MAG: hypothetical protein U0791_16380 [Gemmataceae bacterium]
MAKTFRFEAAAAIYFDVEAENAAEAKAKAACLIQEADTAGYDLDLDEEHDGRAYFDLSSVPEIVNEEE